MILWKLLDESLHIHRMLPRESLWSSVVNPKQSSCRGSVCTLLRAPSYLMPICCAHKQRVNGRPL